MNFSDTNLFFIGILILQLISDSSGRRPRSHGRKFVRGVGATLPSEPGDTVVSNLVVHEGVPVYAPYRWYYAVKADVLLQFSYKKRSWFMETKPKIINIKSDKYKDINFQNRGKKNPHIGKIGSLIAILMANSGKHLPFHFLFCNSKHYVEYLSRGYANGKWYKLLFNKTSKNCPVFAPLQADLQTAHDLFHSKKFVLKDRNNGEIELSIDAWPADLLPPPPIVFG